MGLCFLVGSAWSDFGRQILVREKKSGLTLCSNFQSAIGSLTVNSPVKNGKEKNLYFFRPRPFVPYNKLQFLRLPHTVAYMESIKRRFSFYFQMSSKSGKYPQLLILQRDFFFSDIIIPVVVAGTADRCALAPRRNHIFYHFSAYTHSVILSRTQRLCCACMDVIIIITIETSLYLPYSSIISTARLFQFSILFLSIWLMMSPTYQWQQQQQQQTGLGLLRRKTCLSLLGGQRERERCMFHSKRQQLCEFFCFFSIGTHFWLFPLCIGGRRWIFYRRPPNKNVQVPNWLISRRQLAGRKIFKIPADEKWPAAGHWPNSKRLRKYK